MDEARGTLFFNIASIIKAHHPKVVLLENVRNLIGPRHEHEWDVIIETLREEGYHVSDQAGDLLAAPAARRAWAGDRRSASASSSPRRDIRQSAAGGHRVRRPAARRDDDGPVPGHRSATTQFRPPKVDWHLDDLLDDSHNIPGCDLTDSERTGSMRGTSSCRSCAPLMGDATCRATPSGRTLGWTSPRCSACPATARPRDAQAARAGPGFVQSVTRPHIDARLPRWKQCHLAKNYDMFARHFEAIIPWAADWGVYTDASRRRGASWSGRRGDASPLGHGHALPPVRHPRQEGRPISRPSWRSPRPRSSAPRAAPSPARLHDSRGCRTPSSSLISPRPRRTSRWATASNVGAVAHVFREHLKRDRVILEDASGEHLDSDEERIRAERLLGAVDSRRSIPWRRFVRTSLPASGRR